MKSIEKVIVVGAGQMGRGIAQVLAQSKFKVYLSDANLDLANTGKETLDKSLERLVGKEKISKEDKLSILKHIEPVSAFDDAADADLAIEAASEDEAIKAKIFKGLDKALGAGAILASNTSSISITRLGAYTQRPEQVIGMHFMNPVPVMKLVEVISGETTSAETLAAVVALSEKMGKVVVQSQDYPGFIVNRILMPMINEAAFALMEGVATAKDIDAAMKLGTNQPMGPLVLADFIGLDTCLSILEVMNKGLGDPKYRPCPLLRRMVDAGHLGRKAGRGFHDYSLKSSK